MTAQRTTLAVWAAALMVSLGIFAWLPAQIAPAEDAVILFRYSEHLSRGLGIVYNARGPHVEGATDFGWMVILSLGRWFGSTFALALALSAIASWVTIHLLCRLAATRDHLLLLGTAFLVLLNPTVGAGVQGFSVLFFGMFLTAILVMAAERNSRGLYLASLLACLVRPDASILAAPVVIGDLLRRQKPRERVQRFRDLLLILIIPGVSYFAWRWWYFGLPWPLPFYVKVAAAKRTAGLFVPTSLLNVSRYALTVLPIAVAAWLPRDRLSWSKLAPTLLGASAFFFYSMINLEQDACGRFEYPLFIAAATLAAVDVRAHGLTRRLLLGTALALVLLIPASITGLVGTYQSADTSPIVDLSRALGRLPPGRLATTEAGRLAYYSNWDVIDLWGLNDPELARHFVQPRDVKDLQADLISLHINLELLKKRHGLEPQSVRSWEGMATNALLGMGDDYDLWLVPVEKPPPSPALEVLSWVRAHEPLELMQRLVLRSLYRVSHNGPKLEAYERFIGGQDVHVQRLDLFAIRKNSPLRGALQELLESAKGQVIRED